jgi:hypothetical protein
MVSFNIHRKRSAEHLLPVSLSSSTSLLLGKSPHRDLPATCFFSTSNTTVVVVAAAAAAAAAFAAV